MFLYILTVISIKMNELCKVCSKIAYVLLLKTEKEFKRVYQDKPNNDFFNIHKKLPDITNPFLVIVILI